jgi:hypothetical protein
MPCNREATGNLLENPSRLRKSVPKTSENSVVCEGFPDKFPAPEQGINSTTTGNLISDNREIIRANREMAKIDSLAATERLFCSVAGFARFRGPETADWSGCTRTTLPDARIYASLQLFDIE